MVSPATVAVVLCACGSAPDLDVRDHDLFWPTLRLQWRRAGEPRTGPGGNSLVVEGSYGHGVFAGGDSNYDLFALQTRVQAGSDPNQPVSARLLAGLEYTYLGIEDARLSPSRPEAHAVGPMLGLEFGWNCWQDSWLYARGTAAGQLLATTSTRLEAGLSAWPSEGLELALGYRWWRVRSEDILGGVLGGTDIDLRTEGIVLALGFVF